LSNKYINSKKITKLKLSIFGLSLLTTSFILYSCNKDDDSTVTPTTGTPTEGTVSILSTVQAKYKSMVTISTSDNSITLCSNGTPDHVSPYWDATNALYEAQMSGSTVSLSLIILGCFKRFFRQDIGLNFS
jgi:hypothetical protein